MDLGGPLSQNKGCAGRKNKQLAPDPAEPQNAARAPLDSCQTDARPSLGPGDRRRPLIRKSADFRFRVNFRPMLQRVRAAGMRQLLTHALQCNCVLYLGHRVDQSNGVVPSKAAIHPNGAVSKFCKT
jgi:hypothetical protein